MNRPRGFIRVQQPILAEKEFRVFSLLNLDAPHLRDPAITAEEEDVREITDDRIRLKNSLKLEPFQISTCCGLRKRYLAASMRIAETGLLPG